MPCPVFGPAPHPMNWGCPCLANLLTPRVGLPARCVDAAVKPEGLRRTPPLLGMNPLFCLLGSFPEKELPAARGMACTSVSVVHVCQGN